MVSSSLDLARLELTRLDLVYGRLRWFGMPGVRCWLALSLWRSRVAHGRVAGIASAQDRRQNQPGQFDFYVLALSWSPSFCEAAGERGRRRSSNAAARPYLLRRARAVAAIRKRLSGILPGAGAAARPQHHHLDARPDAGAAADLSRVGQARHLLGPRCASAYFETVRKARAHGENPGRLSRRRRSR